MHKTVQENNIRLDQWLAKEEKKESGQSRGYWQKKIKSGQVILNGKKVSPHHKLKEGDTVEIKIKKAPTQFSAATPSNEKNIGPLPFRILFEDENYLVIDKPAGLVVHPGPGHHEKTLVNILKEHQKQLSALGDDNRAGIVHRLDKDTSGVMVIAKTDKAHMELGNQFTKRTVKKEYITLVHGILQPMQGSIEAPLGRGKKNRTRIEVTVGRKSRYALTHYEVKKYFQTPFPASLLKVKIETGRTHQIRVHFEAIGHPVIGDPVYRQRKNKENEENLNLNRQFLHAHSLEFRSPTTKKKVRYASKLHEELQKILKKFR